MKSSRKELRDKDIGYSIEEWKKMFTDEEIRLSLSIPFQIASPELVIRFENQEVFDRFIKELVDLIYKYSKEVKIERAEKKEEAKEVDWDLGPRFYMLSQVSWTGENIRVTYDPTMPEKLFIDIMKLIDKYFDKIKIIDMRVSGVKKYEPTRPSSP